MSESSSGPTYRFRTFKSKERLREGYRHSVEVIDEATGAGLCSCHLVGGRVSLTSVPIEQSSGPALMLTPDRAIMPARWILSADGEPRIAELARRSLSAALVNPLGRTLLTVFDARGSEIGQLVDPRASAADRVVGPGPSDWRLVRGEVHLATLRRLTSDKAPAKTFLGRVLDALTSSDWGLVSLGDGHAISAPVALVMLLLFEDLTAPSAG